MPASVLWSMEVRRGDEQICNGVWVSESLIDDGGVVGVSWQLGA